MLDIFDAGVAVVSFLGQSTERRVLQVFQCDRYYSDDFGTHCTTPRPLKSSTAKTCTSRLWKIGGVLDQRDRGAFVASPSFKGSWKGQAQSARS